MKLENEHSYNKNAILIIEAYGSKHGYNFRHAENHKHGEFHIYDKENHRRYYADGYDEAKNVWLEYNEPQHKNKLEEDMKRQNNIIALLRCKFIRINGEI